MFVHGLVVLLYGIPFIDNNNYSFASLMRDTGYLGVLLRDTLSRINNNKYDICTLNRADGTDDAVTLKIFFDFALPS